MNFEELRVFLAQSERGQVFDSLAYASSLV